MNKTKHELIIEAIISLEKSYLKFTSKVVFGISFFLSIVSSFLIEGEESIGFSVFFIGVYSVLLAVIFYGFGYLIFLIHSLNIKYSIPRLEIIPAEVESYNLRMKFYQLFTLKSLNGKSIKPYLVRSPVYASKETKQGYLIKSPIIHYFFPKDYLD
jgi:hypothetical protein